MLDFAEMNVFFLKPFKGFAKGLGKVTQSSGEEHVEVTKAKNWT